MKPRIFDSITKATKWLAKHGHGRALHVITLHEDWCPSGPGSRDCTCTPHVRIEDLTVENLLHADRKHREWLKRHERN